MSSAARPKVVIVGGGFGGLATAKALSGVAADVTLVDRSNHHLFQPLLYQVAMAGLSPADIAVPIRRVLRHQKNVRVLLGEVVRVDIEENELTLDDGTTLPFEYLVIAAGARTNYFGKEDTWRAHSLGLKTVDEALEIRRRVLIAFEAAERETDEDARKRLLTFVVIGGGPTGVEIAGALADLSRTVLADDFRAIDPKSARILLIEAADRLLPGAFDARLAERAKEQLAELGVEVLLGKKVEDIDEQGVIAGGERVESSTVLWTAGVKGRGLARSLGVKLDGGDRVIVEQDCSLPEHPDVFAIGDIARFVPEGESAPLAGIAPVAAQQGRHVAIMIERRIAGKATEPFHYVDKGMMATIGRSRAVAQTLNGKLRLSGFLAWLAWLFVHIWFLIDFRNRLSVLFNWAWNYVSYRRGARLITGERSWELLLRLTGKSPPADPPEGPRSG